MILICMYFLMPCMSICNQLTGMNLVTGTCDVDLEDFKYEGGGLSPGELFVYLYGVGEKRVAIKENQSIGLYPASLALDAVFPNGGALTKAVGIS